MSDNVVRVEVLKELVTVVTNIVEEVEARLADGWQWLSDSVAIGGALLALLRFIPKWKAIWEEFIDLDEDEVKELQEHFKTELDLTHEDAEAFVELVTDFADEVYAVVQSARGIYDWVKGS